MLFKLLMLEAIVFALLMTPCILIFGNWLSDRLARTTKLSYDLREWITALAVFPVVVAPFMVAAVVLCIWLVNRFEPV